MPGHDARSNMAAEETLILSTVDAEVLTVRDEWGCHYLVDRRGQTGLQTRTIVPPSHAGQRVDISVISDNNDDVELRVVDVPIFEAGAVANKLVFDANGFCILQSFETASGPRWFATYMKNVTLA